MTGSISRRFGSAILKILVLTAGAIVLSGCARPAGREGVTNPAFRVGKVTFGLSQAAVWSAKSDKIAVRDRDLIRVFNVVNPAHPRPLRNIRIPELDRIDWSPDGKYLLAEVAERRLVANEPNRLILIDTRDWRRRAIAGPEGQYFFWLDRSSIGYFSLPSRDLNNVDLYAYDLVSRSERLLLRKAGFFEVIKSLPGGELLTSSAGRGLSTTISAINLRDGNRRKLFSDSQGISVSDNGRAVILRPLKWKQVSSGGKQLIAFPAYLGRVSSKVLKVGKGFEIHDDNGVKLLLSSISLSPNGRLLAFEGLEPGKATVYIASIK